MIKKKNIKLVIVIIALILSIIIYTNFINPKYKEQSSSENSDQQPLIIFINPTSGAFPTGFLSTYFNSIQGKAADKYGYYIEDATKKKSTNYYKCMTDRTSTKYLAPCYYYKCDSKYKGYSPASSKPSKYKGKWSCGFIKYPRSYY